MCIFRETGCDPLKQAGYFNVKSKPLLEHAINGIETDAEPVLNWLIVQLVHIVSGTFESFFITTAQYSF